MPAYKRQHYLPCVYLKNFSPDGIQATRNSQVWRVDDRRCFSVPVKSQCAGDYLFSKSSARESEEEFQTAEAGYSQAVAKIWAKGEPTVREYLALILTMFDLYARNIVHENRTGREGREAYHLRTTSLLNRLVLGCYASDALPQAELLARLKKAWRVRLFRTPSGREIVTSDHPVLCFNWGNGDEIDFLLMPVTPFVCAAAFNRYTTRTTGSSLSEADGSVLFHALGTHCHSCLYTMSQPVPEAADAFRLIRAGQPTPRSVTDAEKWSLDLIVPTQSDVFSFIRPI